MIFVTYGQVPGCPGYNNWLVLINGVFTCDFGKREDAERYVHMLLHRDMATSQGDNREPHLQTM